MQGFARMGKGLVASKGTNQYVMYALEQREGPTGTQLEIVPKIKSSDGTLLNAKDSILPIIPYRFQMHTELTSSEIDTFFNPGGIPTGQNSSFYEVNLTRNQIGLIPRNYDMFKTPDGGRWFRAKNTQITCHDIQASIHVEQSGGTDIIYLSVVTRVDIEGIIEGTGRPKNGGTTLPVFVNTSVSYVIPVVLRYTVDRSKVMSSSVFTLYPTAFGYPIDIGAWTASRSVTKKIVKINQGIASTPPTKLFNYNIIPMTFGEHWKSDEYVLDRDLPIPLMAGGSCDLTVSSAIVYCVCAHGNDYQPPGTYLPQQKFHVTNFDFSGGGFTEPTVWITPTNIPSLSFYICQKVTIDTVGSFIMLGMWTASNGNTVGASECTLATYNIADGSRASLHTFTNTTHIDITTFGSTFIVSLFSTADDRLYLIKANTVAGLNQSKRQRWHLVDTSIKKIGSNVLGPGIYTLMATLPFRVDYLRTTPGFYKSSAVSYDKSTAYDSFMITNYMRDFSVISHSNQYIHLVFAQGVLRSTYKIPSSSSNVHYSTRELSTVFQQRYQVPEQFLNMSAGEDAFIKLNVYGNIESATMSEDRVFDLQTYATYTPKYWYNPSLNEEALGYKDPDTLPGVRLMVDMVNVSGFYIKTWPAAWNSAARPSVINATNGANGQGGVELSAATLREDLDIMYDGRSSEVSGSGGYWTYLTSDGKADVGLTYKGYNILIDNANDYAVPVVFNYSDTGLASIHVRLRLQLGPHERYPAEWSNGVVGDDGTSTYENAAFVMTDCIFKFRLLNKFGEVIGDIGSNGQTITINPPDPSGSITTASTKVVSSPRFTMTRDSDSKSETYTTMRDVVVEHFVRSEGQVQPRDALNFAEPDGRSTLTIPISSRDLAKGDYVQMRYKPMLFDKKGLAEAQYTDAVSYVKGHRYIIPDNTGAMNIYFDSSGTYTTTRNSLIYDGKPYIYVDTSAGGSMNVKVTLDLEHEDWALEPSRLSMNAYDVYPTISSVYLYATPPFTMQQKNWEEPELRYKTYPNVSYDGATRLFNYFVSQGYPSGLVNPAVNSTSLSSQDIILSITKSGPYMLWLMVEDEYIQRSMFCLTNLYTFKAPLTLD